MVEWKKLGEVCTFNRGRTITAKDAVDGSIPVIAGGQTPSYYHNESNRDGESITVAGSGAYAGFVSYWSKPIFVSDAFTVDPSRSIKHKYLFQWLKMNQKRIFETQKGAGVPHVHGKDIANFLIPIPSLEEQTRIVGILDTFTSAIDNLKEQIALRRKQYEYYRDQLLDLEGKPGVEMKMIEEITKRNKGIPITAEQMSELASINGNIRVFAAGATMADIDEDDLPKNCAHRLPSVIVKSRGHVDFEFYEGPFTHKNEMWSYSFESKEKAKYLYYFLTTKTDYFRKKAKTNSVKLPQLCVADTDKYKIPIPSLDEQARIVSILDTFEASVANLEAQLELRQKQYEYYRNKLLTFEK